MNEEQRRSQFVGRFAGVMREKLLIPRNVAKGTWEKGDPAEIFGRLRDEVDELFAALADHLVSPSQITADAVALEAADVALFAGQIADVVGGLPHEG